MNARFTICKLVFNLRSQFFLIDRLRFGAVVDFLDFYIGTHHWPAFNGADSAITVGVGLFLLGTLQQHFKETRKE